MASILNVDKIRATGSTTDALTIDFVVATVKPTSSRLARLSAPPNTGTCIPRFGTVVPFDQTTYNDGFTPSNA